MLRLYKHCCFIKTKPPFPGPLRSPEFYCEEHKQRSYQLHKEYIAELKQLKAEQAESLRAARRNLRKNYCEEVEQNKRQQQHALELYQDKVVRQNISIKFRHIRLELKAKYKDEKWKLSCAYPRKCKEQRRELLDRFAARQDELSLEYKKKYHREIFDKILATLPVDHRPRATEPDGVAGESSPAFRTIKVPTLAGEASEQVITRAKAEVSKALSVRSKLSSASTQTRKSARSKASSKHSALTLQEVPLLGRSPFAASEATALDQRQQPQFDEVRNFWGRIIRKMLHIKRIRDTLEYRRSPGKSEHWNTEREEVYRKDLEAHLSTHNLSETLRHTDNMWPPVFDLPSPMPDSAHSRGDAMTSKLAKGAIGVETKTTYVASGLQAGSDEYEPAAIAAERGVFEQDLSFTQNSSHNRDMTGTEYPQSSKTRLRQDVDPAKILPTDQYQPANRSPFISQARLGSKGGPFLPTITSSTPIEFPDIPPLSIAQVHIDTNTAKTPTSSVLDFLREADNTFSSNRTSSSKDRPRSFRAEADETISLPPWKQNGPSMEEWIAKLPALGDGATDSKFFEAGNKLKKQKPNSVGKLRVVNDENMSIDANLVDEDGTQLRSETDRSQSGHRLPIAIDQGMLHPNFRSDVSNEEPPLQGEELHLPFQPGRLDTLPEASLETSLCTPTVDKGVTTNKTLTAIGSQSTDMQHQLKSLLNGLYLPKGEVQRPTDVARLASNRLDELERYWVQHGVKFGTAARKMLLVIDGLVVKEREQAQAHQRAMEMGWGDREDLLEVGWRH